MPFYNPDLNFPNRLDYFFPPYGSDFNGEVAYEEPLPPLPKELILFSQDPDRGLLEHTSMPSYETALIEQDYEGEPLPEMFSSYSGEWWGDNRLTGGYVGGYYGYDEEEVHGHFLDAVEAGFGHGWDEMKLCESTFGYYYPEHYAEQVLA